jgi:tetratricopeptide (TPR) repeat protein
MSMASIQCSCGQQIDVREAQAGMIIRCACGQELIVPSLQQLRAQAGEDAPLSARPRSTAHEELPEPATDERRFLILLTSPPELQNRISFDAARHFITACDRFLQHYFDQHDWDLDLQIAMALMPNGSKLVEVQARPSSLPAQVVDELVANLNDLRSPPVVDGPVAFAIRRPVCGGSPVLPVTFDVPFISFMHQPGELDEILLQAAGLARARAARPWYGWLAWLWQRSTTWLRSDRDSTRETDEAGPQEATNPKEEHIAAAVESNSIEQITACLDFYPDSVDLHLALGALLMQEGRYQEAVSICDRWLLVAPESAAAYAARARAHCAAGSMQQGLADYGKAIEGDPSDAESRAARAMLYLELEAWEAAETDLTHAIELAPIQPQLFVERARARFYQERLDAAQADLQHALHLDPYFVEAYMLSGWILQNSPDASPHDVAEAVNYYTEAISIEPDNPGFLLQRAEAYAGQNKYALTIDDCDRVLKLDENHAVAYGIRGYAQQQLDNLPAAVTDCTKAIDLGLRSAAVYFSRAVGLAADGDVESAMVDCDTAIDLAPDYAAAYNYRGMLHLGQGDVEAASEDFAEASRLAPAWSTPREFRADTHRLSAEYPQAIERYSETIALEPNNLTAYIGRALARVEQQEFDGAWDDLTRAVEIDDECVPAYFHRAELAMQREQLEQAVADLDRAIALDPDFAPAYHARAQTYLQMQRNEDAIRDFSKLIELHPEWPGAYVGRAGAWINLGDKRKAAADYDEAAQLDPDSTGDLHVHRLIVEAHHLHESEDYQAAIAKATEAIEQDSGSLAAWATRAASHWYLEQFVESVDDYSRLLEIHAEAPFALVGRGQVYAELGEYELALADLEKAVEMERKAASATGLAYALNGRALAYAGLGRFEEAQRDFDESVRLRPSNAFLHYNRGLVYRQLEDIAKAVNAFRQALQHSQPQLTPRKRERASAFLQQYEGQT